MAVAVAMRGRGRRTRARSGRRAVVVPMVTMMVPMVAVVFMVLVTGSGFGVMAVVSSRVPLVPFRPVVRRGLCYRRKQCQHG